MASAPQSRVVQRRLTALLGRKYKLLAPFRDGSDISLAQAAASRSAAPLRNREVTIVTPEILFAFAVTCLVIELTPGPNMAYLAVLVQQPLLEVL